MDTLTKLALIGGGLGLIYFAVKTQAPKIVPYVDPTNEKNIANQAFNKVYQTITGSEQSMGADFYDLTHPAFDDPGYGTQKMYELPPIL